MKLGKIKFSYQKILKVFWNVVFEIMIEWVLILGLEILECILEIFYRDVCSKFRIWKTKYSSKIFEQIFDFQFQEDFSVGNADGNFFFSTFEYCVSWPDSKFFPLVKLILNEYLMKVPRFWGEVTIDAYNFVI